jgi:hypothetical protein
VFTNTSTEGTLANVTLSVSSSTGDLLNLTSPLLVRINLTNVDDYDGLSKFSEGQVRFYIDRCTNDPPNNNCSYNFTSLGEQKDIVISIFANDTSGAEVTSTRTFTIDTETPVLQTNNWTMSSSQASINLQVTDVDPANCTLRFFDRASALATSGSGSFTLGTGTANCTGTFTSSNITLEGAFNLEYTVVDSSGNSVAQNVSGVYTTLYTGWNLVTMPDILLNASVLCSQIASCTQISSFNNLQSSKTFTTYSTSTPSINGDTNFNPGDAVLVYVSADSSMISNNNLPVAGSAEENFTASYGGWNTMGLLYATTIDTIINVTAASDSTQKNITFVSYYNTSSDEFYTCKRSLNKCAGTNVPIDEITLRKGYAVWALTDVNVTMNRTQMQG